MMECHLVLGVERHLAPGIEFVGHRPDRMKGSARLTADPSTATSTSVGR